MVTLYRSVSIAPGKTVSALTYAREMAAWVSQKTGVDVHVAMPIGGNPNRVGFSAQYENLGALEAAQLKIAADPTYMELAAKGADNFMAGTMHDEIWRTI